MHRNPPLLFYFVHKIIHETIKNINSNTYNKCEKDQNQELITKVASSPYYNGRKIYIDHFEQSYVLSAELYGDLVPAEGGLNEFLKDNTSGSLLFIPKEEVSKVIKDKSSLKIVSENKDSFIFTKQ